MKTLYDRVKAGELLVMDGGTGTELALRGIPHENDTCWSARAILENPDAVAEAHADFVRAGADIIVANTFRASLHVLRECGLEDRFEEINATAVKLAQKGIVKAVPSHQVHVVGTISTVEAESFQLPADEERENYARQAKVLADAGVEAILVENVRDLHHGKLALEGAHGAGIAVWAGLSCELDDKGTPVLTGDKTPLADAVSTMSRAGVRVIGIMHTIIGHVSTCLTVINQHWTGPVCVRPHAAPTPIPSQSVADAWTPEDYRSKARKWMLSGVRIIGGCCGLRPAHIDGLKKNLKLLG